MVKPQPFSTNSCRGTQHTAVETIHVQFLQQDEPHQVLGSWGETTAIQIYAAVHTRRTRHSFAFACTAWCKNWFEGSRSHIRRPRWHVALSCFPKGYPMSHLSEVRDTEQHTVCRDQQTGLVIGSQRMWQPNWDTCLYRLWHIERLRQSKEAECTEAHEKWHNIPRHVYSSWTVMGCTTSAIWEGTTIHLSYVNSMWLLAALPRWTTCADSSFVPKEERLSPAVTSMQILSLHAPPSSQLPGSKLEVLSTCSSHIARPYRVWMDRWWWQARSPFTGCGGHQHNMLSWKCWFVSVSVLASWQSVRA